MYRFTHGIRSTASPSTSINLSSILWRMPRDATPQATIVPTAAATIAIKIEVPSRPAIGVRGQEANELTDESAVLRKARTVGTTIFLRSGSSLILAPSLVSRLLSWSWYVYVCHHSNHT